VEARAQAILAKLACKTPDSGGFKKGKLDTLPIALSLSLSLAPPFAALPLSLALILQSSDTAQR
jgi:hypothetical protein